METYTELVGFVAGLLTTVAFLPQMIQVWRSKSVSGISLPMYLIYSLGIVLWVAYGVMLGAPALIIANSFALVFSSSILVMKLMWS